MVELTLTRRDLALLQGALRAAEENAWDNVKNPDGTYEVLSDPAHKVATELRFLRLYLQERIRQAREEQGEEQVPLHLDDLTLSEA